MSRISHRLDAIQESLANDLEDIRRDEDFTPGEFADFLAAYWEDPFAAKIYARFYVE